MMNIEPFFDERTYTLTYVVWDAQTKDAVVIDPVLDFEPSNGRIWAESVDVVTKYVKDHQLKLHYIFETHAHADHLSGSQYIRRQVGGQVAISERIKGVQAVFRDVFGWPEMKADGSQFDRLLVDNEVVEAGALRIKVLPTPGHTPACSSFMINDAVFTGDALFVEDVGVGRCDFPKGDASALYDSVQQQLFTLPDNTRVFVGHDYPPATRKWQAETTIGAAKKANAHLTAGLGREDFIAKRKARDATLAAPRLLFPSIQVNIAAGNLPAGEDGRVFLKAPVKVAM